MLEYLVEAGEGAIPLIPVAKANLETILADQPERVRQWARASGFTAEMGTICTLPNTEGEILAVLAGLGDGTDPWAFAHLPAKLPPGTYSIGIALERSSADWAALGWLLACYGFNRYKTRTPPIRPRLVWPETANRPHVARLAAATRLVRDLINTPASDMGPADIAAAAERLAMEHCAQVRVITGEGLLAENYPMIHAVGRAASHPRQPRLIDLVWGDEHAPKLTLVGKGVCFDTGGLDLKPSANMKLMKKDMGGAAHVLGLASMIMGAGLKVRLRVLIPAVENSVSGESMRPMDVLSTRKGITVEIGNTDAEGRLILADALWEAAREKPALLIDIATLTGAARTALGPDLPALFTNDDSLAADLLSAGEAEHDPLWRLPLFKPYRRMIDSKVADLSSASDSPHAGAITAALFLQEFVPVGIPWAHLDVLAWNNSFRPGRPDGGEAMGLRGLFAAITHKFTQE